MRNLLIALLLVCGTFADAQSVRSGLNTAFEHIALQDYDNALSILDELRVGHPDDPRIEYAMASARYARASALYEDGNPEMAEVSMRAVLERFNEIAMTGDSPITRDARLNAAKSASWIANEKATEYLLKKAVQPEDYKGALSDTQAAVSAYQQFLIDYPGDKIAEANLNHARYLLKSVQQKQIQEPPDQENQDDEEGESDEDEEGDQKGEQGDENPEDDDSEEKQDENGEDQNNPAEDENNTDQAGKGNESKGDMEQNSLSRQNIEAILQSLEDVDREEQEKLHRATGRTRIQDGNWW